mgnify:CR=1 FL=1
MRVRIIGGIGSGKTYLAKRLSRKFSIPHVCLDDIFWDDNLDNYFAKRTPAARDRLLDEALKKI